MPIPPASPDQTVFGIKYSMLIVAFLGSALSLSYAKEMTRKQAITAVLTGTSVAVMGAPVALHYLGLPDTLERAISFFLALVAMRLVPAGLALIDRLRDLKLPWLSDTKSDPKE